METERIKIRPARGFAQSALVSGYLTLVFIAGWIVFADQWTKTWVRENLAYGESWMPWSALSPYARVLHWRNTGAAFGMLQEWGGIFTILAIIVALMIVYYFPRIERGDWPLRLAMGLQLGGALGNLVDRLQHGYVTDFISIGNFPIFNVADSSITVGVVILLFSVWFGDSPANDLDDTTP
ncbi:MAG: signal peptidase II [Anaerolineales bacterium]